MNRTRISTVVAAILVAGAVQAQDYPQRPIRMICPSGPGTIDIVTRTVSKSLGELLGQPVVVENRPGASTSIGEEAAARSTPDGYTLVMSGLPIATAQYLRKGLTYDPQKDLEPVSLVAITGNVLVVNTSLPVTSVRELIEVARSRAKPMFYGIATYGGSGHLAAELFQQMAGAKFEPIPYKGSAQSLQALLAGDIDITFDNIPTAGVHVRAGKLRALGITSEKRSPLMPDVPTIAEAGMPGYAVTAWFGIFAPAKTPAEIIHRLQAETAKAVASPEVRERFANLGFEPVGSTAQEFRRFIVAETAKMGSVIQRAGMKAE